MLSRRIATGLSLLAGVVVGFGAAGAPALAAETHPFLEPLGGSPSPVTFTDPNGIAVEESTGDVYVADIATGTVSKFDAKGNPVEFSSLHSNVLSGAGTPAGSFSFPNVYGTPAAVAVDNSTEPSDPSRGDLYVMDAGHGAIDKFTPSGEYLSRISGPFEGKLWGLALTANGSLRVEAGIFGEDVVGGIVLFDNAQANNFISRLTLLEPTDSSAESTPEHSFAVGLTGTDYTLFECGCVEEFGSNSTYMNGLGRVDNGPGDVAMAVDPVSGHLYVDEQSSVAELDTGGVDGYTSESVEEEGSGVLVSSFGSLQFSGASAQQGGIAVNGANGEIYVSNPATGQVYVFASTPPAVAAGTATNITQTHATLQGSIDPRGAAVTSCVFEYEKARRGTGGGEEFQFAVPITFFAHSAPCAQSATQIGSGASPVEVSAEIGGLEAGVLYVFRLVAGNAGGTSPSEGLVAAQSAGFGIKSLSVSFLNQDGTPDLQAGSHPYEMVTSFTFNTQAAQRFVNLQSSYRFVPVGNAKDIVFTPPPGLIGNPNATDAKCTISELGEGFGDCPAGSQVGVLYVETTAYGTGNYPLYNMVPPHGVAAQFGAKVIAPKAFIDVGLQAGGQYPVQAESLNIPAIEPVLRLRTTLYCLAGLICLQLG